MNSLMSASLLSPLRRMTAAAHSRFFPAAPPAAAHLSTESSPPPESAAAPAAADGDNVTFAHLLRNCRFTQMGDPIGKVVVGRVYHTVNDDLYVDVGHKFPVVCQRPRRLRSAFVRGTEVRVLLRSLELSQKFLGYEKEMTLMEADGVLLGLHEPEGAAGRRGFGRRGRPFPPFRGQQKQEQETE